jgi:hypothetical protein
MVSGCVSIVQQEEKTNTLEMYEMRKKRYSKN